MSFQQLLKMADNRSKDSVFGYIRQSRKNINDTAIPTMIQYCCLKYYFINEYFTKCGDDLKISQNGKIVSKPDNVYRFQSVYGNVLIDIDNISISKYVWTKSIPKYYFIMNISRNAVTI